MRRATGVDGGDLLLVSGSSAASRAAVALVAVTWLHAGSSWW